MCILNNFMEDYAFHEQQKAEYEFRMWELYLKQKEQEEKDYLLQAPQYFKDLEEYETSMMEKEYRKILEWDLIND